MQIEPESQNSLGQSSSSVINTRFLKTATFWIRLIIIGLLTAGWISILQIELYNTSLTINIIPIQITDEPLVFGSLCNIYFEILKYVKPTYLGIAISAWILSIIYIAVNLFNIQRYCKGFSLRVLFRVLDGIITFFMTWLWILVLATTVYAYLAEGVTSLICQKFGANNLNSLGAAEAFTFLAWLFYLIDSCVRCCLCCGENSGKEF